MQSRAVMATAAAITATIVAGGIAAGATTGLLGIVERGGPGGVELVDHSAAASKKRVVTVYVDDPPAPAAAAAGAGAGAAGTSAGRAAPRPASPAPVAANGARSATPAPSPVRTPAPAPAPATTPTTAGNSGGPWNCAGSDDGMSEAQKQAREAYCHGQEDDDD